MTAIGKCTRPEGCKPECAQLRMLCEFYNCEHEPDDCALYSIGRWNKLGEGLRKTVLDHLRTSLLQSTGEGGRKALAKWRDQRARGIQCGSDDIRFHFSGGRAVRNIIRQVVRDDKLPDQNWDDYYYGAISALAAEEVPA